MFARFDENPAMTLRVIKETKRYGRTDARTDGRTDARTDNVKTVYPLQTKFAGGIINQTLSYSPRNRVCASYRTPFRCYENLIRSGLLIYPSHRSG